MRDVPGFRRIALAALFAAGLAGLTAARTLGADPYQINAVLSLTGNAAFLGAEEAQALAVIEKLENAKGGIGGRPIKFVIADDQSSPQNSVQLTAALIARNAPIVIGSSVVGECSAMAPLVDKNGPVHYCLSPGIHPPAGSYSFSASAGSRDIAAVVLRYFRQRGWTKIGLLTSNDGTGQDFEEQLRLANGLPENASMHVAIADHFNPTDISVSAQISRMKAANVQAVIAWTTGTPFGTVLHAIQDSGLDVPILGAAGNMTLSEMKQYAPMLPATLLFPATEGVSRAGMIGPGPIRDAQLVYFKAFDDAGIKTDFAHNLAWDPTMILIEAVRHTGVDADAAKIHQFIEHLHGYAGIDGIYDFRDGLQRGVSQSAMVMYRWDAAANGFVRLSKGGGRL